MIDTYRNVVGIIVKPCLAEKRGNLRDLICTHFFSSQMRQYVRREFLLIDAGLQSTLGR